VRSTFQTVSLERLSGNSRWCRFRGPTSPCNGANRRPFRRLAPSKYAPANPSSYFPDSLWKRNSRKFAVASSTGPVGA
jgi:hypothetical protein